LLPNSKKNIMNALHQLEERTMLKGRIEGIQEGMLKGKLEGIQEGTLKGIQEGMLKGKLEIAKQLILLTQDLKLVHKATKLSMKILLALQKELKG
jgi:predicted transposase YdaD